MVLGVLYQRILVFGVLGGGIRRKRNSEKEQVVFDLEDVLILP